MGYFRIKQKQFSKKKHSYPVYATHESISFGKRSTFDSVLEKKFFNVLEPYGFIYYSIVAPGVNGRRNHIKKDSVTNETRRGVTSTFFSGFQ